MNLKLINAKVNVLLLLLVLTWGAMGALWATGVVSASTQAPSQPTTASLELALPIDGPDPQAQPQLALGTWVEINRQPLTIGDYQALIGTTIQAKVVDSEGNVYLLLPSGVTLTSTQRASLATTHGVPTSRIKEHVGDEKAQELLEEIAGLGLTP